MKRNAVLFTVLFASVFLLYAQDNAPKEMTGWICSSACVSQSGGHATCDANCAGANKSGDAVFVEDNGKVSTISNPDMVKGKMGQKVKAKCQMNKDKESMEILELIQANAG
jgi:hypothetical protein